jgi:serine/threonine protein kinase
MSAQLLALAPYFGSSLTTTHGEKFNGFSARSPVRGRTFGTLRQLKQPRVFYASDWIDNNVSRPGRTIVMLYSQQTTDPNMNNTFANASNLETAEDAAAPTDELGLEKCVPMSDWQTASFPTCNTFHEIDLPLSSADNAHGKTTTQSQEQLTVLGEGWFRTAWRLEQSGVTTVLKTLRIEREFLEEYYELHRRDAIAMERLTRSPFVVDIFAYCGQSAVNEIANFPFPDVKDLEHFDRRLRYHDSPQINRIKLQVAASVAQGLADIHSIDGDNGTPTMAHYDINPRNIAMFSRGRPKINDFNIAEFLRRDPATNKTCGFPNRMHQPWWRAPEEVNVSSLVAVSEKVDIWALGGVLFHVMTTHSPRGKMKAERMELIRAEVAAGQPPVLMEPYASSRDPIFVAFRKALSRCFVVDPVARATASEIADILFDALLKVIDHPEKVKKKEKLKAGRPM